MNDQIEQTKNIEITLREIVTEVADEENLTVEPLEEEYVQNYTKLTPTSPDRCVDGRDVSDKDKAIPYNGMQTPGGTAAFFDTLVLLGLSEDSALGVVHTTYDNNGLKMGMHGDTEHEKFGCGNQRLIVNNKLEMIPDGQLTEDKLDERREFVDGNGGTVLDLDGEHAEKLAAVNIQGGTTFDTTKAVSEKKSIFNLDLYEVYLRAGMIFDTLQEDNVNHDDTKSKDEFQKSFTNIVLKNYFQTAKALVPELENVYLHSH